MSQTKKTAQLVTKSLSIDDERVLHFIATAPTLDRDFEVISTSDIRIPTKNGLRYAKELTDEDETIAPLLIEHDWSIKAQAGVVFKMKMNAQGKLEAWAKLATNDNGNDVYQLAKEDMLNNSFSIGYTLGNATDEDGAIKNIELLEISVVATASNPDAKLIDYKSADKGEKMGKTKLDKIDELKAELKALEAEEAEVENKAEEQEPIAEAPKEAKVEEEKETPTEPSEPAVEEKEEDIKVIKKEEKMNKIAEKAVVKKVETEVEQPETKSAKINKYEFAAKQFVAFVNKDTKTLAELNKQALDSYKGSKAGDPDPVYMNTAVAADGGAIVPEAQLLREVFSTLGEFSTIANDLRVITLTEGNALDVASLVADVVVREVASEGGKKKATKPTLSQEELSLREFAGIAIITKKLVRQAAVNVYNLLRESFARAIANQRAVLALTDANSGIINKDGIVNVPATNNIWKDIRSLPYQIPASAVQGGKYYISRELLEELDTAQDKNGRDLDIVRLSGDGLTGTFKNGFPFAVEEELGGDNPHAVFGAMGRFGILLRQGAVESEIFDTGIVNDGPNGANGTDHNLLQDNKLANRVAFYENVGYPVPGAFAVYDGTTTSV